MNQAYQPASLLARQPSHLLVVAAGHVGNNVFCTPALQLLHRALPNTAIDVVALNAASASVFVGNDAIASVHVARWRWQMTRLAARYDEVVCLHPKSAPLLKRVRVPVTVIAPFNGERHHAEQMLAFAASLVGSSVDDSDRRYHLVAASAHHLVGMGNSLVGIGNPLVGIGNPRIGIHLGCGRTAIHGWKFFYGKRDQHPKLWPTEYYVALAEKLRQRFPDAEFVITGTRNERFLARRFAEAMSNVVDLTGKTSTAALAGVIGDLDLFITHDCGVLHVAATTPTPLLALFGPTRPALTGPWPSAPHHLILQGENMAAITPDMAATAAIELLQRHQSA